MNLYVYEFIHMYAEDVPPVAAAANVLCPRSVAGAGTEAADALWWRR